MNDLDVTIIRKLPSMLWTRMIIHRRGGASLAQIHREFRPGYSSSYKHGSRRLYKNYKGVQVKDSKLIEDVENNLPGTKRLLFHPLWDILKNPDATLDDILLYMDKLDLDLKGKLFSVDSFSKKSVRKKLDSCGQIYYVAKENSLDALACLLMFIRESEIKKQVQAYVISKWEAIFLIYRLAVIYPYSDIMPLLYHLVFNLFVKKNHPLPSEFKHVSFDNFKFDPNIPPQNPIHLVQDTYFGLIWNAKLRHIVSDDQQEQLNFLFWVDHFFNPYEIKKALQKLPLDFDVEQPSAIFPPPLNNLMERIRGDSRKYLLRKGRFLF
jgi:hypothetical protein